MTNSPLTWLASIKGILMIATALVLGWLAGWYTRGTFWQHEVNAEASRIATTHHGIYIPELNLFMTKSLEAVDLYELDSDRTAEIMQNALRKLNEP
jgi:hypothetical protein